MDRTVPASVATILAGFGWKPGTKVSQEIVLG